MLVLKIRVWKVQETREREEVPKLCVRNEMQCEAEGKGDWEILISSRVNVKVRLPS